MANGVVTDVVTQYGGRALRLALSGLLAFAIFSAVSLTSSFGGGATATFDGSATASTAVDPGTPALQRAIASTVKVSVQVCRGNHFASGFAISADQVVTNAHVVAGAQAIQVVSPDGRPRSAVIVLFDPERDVAVLSVGKLGLQPLPLTKVASLGPVVAIGYPMNGAERISAGNLERQFGLVVPDIYGHTTTQLKVWQVGAGLQPGNSGGPVVNSSGAVVGMVFAASKDMPGIDFVLTTGEISADLHAAAGRTVAVPAGPCM